MITNKNIKYQELLIRIMANNKLKPLLVVEDNPGIQKQLKWSFEGYQVYARR